MSKPICKNAGCNLPQAKCQIDYCTAIYHGFCKQHLGSGTEAK
jgi:hypothetical protein